MQVQTERGLIWVEAEYQSEEKAKIDGYSYAFYSKELGKKYIANVWMTEDYGTLLL